MSPVTLKLREPPRQRLNMGSLIPDKLAGMTASAIAELPLYLGNRPMPVGELFEVSGNDPETLVIANACERLDRIGVQMSRGQIIVEGPTGAYLGQDLRGGQIRVQGNVEIYAGSGMTRGEIHIEGNTGDFLGGAIPGERQGMRGGVIIVSGNTGDRAGDRQRRGLVMIRGNAGAYCGARMIAGTIAVLGNTGEAAGFGMRRGTLLLNRKPVSLPVTFNDNGRHTMTFLTLMLRHMAALDGTFASLLSSGREVQRFLGDLAWNGKGEVLVWDQ